jgi:hypothetical protein
VTVNHHDNEADLDFDQTLERLLDLIGRRLDISVRAQGATIIEEVVTATGTLLSGTELPQWLRANNHRLLDDRLRFWLDSGTSFWLCRPDFLRCVWWPANAEADAGQTLMVVLRGCELLIQEQPGQDRRSSS